MLNSFKSLLGKEVKGLFLILWPPYGEDDTIYSDISAGITMAGGDELYVIDTNKEDNWTPTLSIQGLPNSVFPFEMLNSRIAQWRKCELGDAIEPEFYDCTQQKMFSDVVNHKIASIEFFSVEASSPFGVKLNFESDYIMSTATSDGNTIETKTFNALGNIAHFERLGKIVITHL